MRCRNLRQLREIVEVLNAFADFFWLATCIASYRGLRVKDSEHLIRVAAVFLGGILVFAILRGFLVPASFGLYGHYRADAIKDVAALPVVHA